MHEEVFLGTPPRQLHQPVLRGAGILEGEVGSIAAKKLACRIAHRLGNGATVIGIFKGTIEQMVALAILMPIVASMGGNAGTQAMTVTVRAIAMREIGARNMRRMVTREVLVGAVNGLALAVVLGIGAGLFFRNAQLGAVIACALIFNMVVAGLFGTLVPLTINRLKLDPAVASAVFVTTVTDVAGFFAFLGLAAWWFGLW